MIENTETKDETVISVGQRIELRRKEFSPELSIAELATHAGCTYASLHYIIKHPEAGIAADTLVKVAKRLRVNEEWLLYGTGPKEKKLTPQEEALIADLRKLQAPVQETVFTMTANLKRGGPRE